MKNIKLTAEEIQDIEHAILTQIEAIQAHEKRLQKRYPNLLLGVEVRRLRKLLRRLSIKAVR